MSKDAETTGLPEYWKEPEPTGLGLCGWTAILAAVAIPLKLIWEAFHG